jgi:hypothetical protein
VKESNVAKSRVENEICVAGELAKKRGQDVFFCTRNLNGYRCAGNLLLLTDKTFVGRFIRLTAFRSVLAALSPPAQKKASKNGRRRK